MNTIIMAIAWATIDTIALALIAIIILEPALPEQCPYAAVVIKEGFPITTLHAKKVKGDTTLFKWKKGGEGSTIELWRDL